MPCFQVQQATSWCVAFDCGSTYAAAAHFTCHFWNIMTLFNFSNACLMRETPPLGEVMMSVFVHMDTS